MLKVVPGRLELPTSTLSVWRSDQLSYRTMIHREESLPQNDSSRPVALPSLGATKARLPSFPMIKQTAAYKKPVKESHLQVDFLLSNYFAHPLRPSRKEVFQPHLPVRLPCYDLAPITSFALGRSLRSRTSGTPGFHGLTGGVYKAREVFTAPWLMRDY